MGPGGLRARARGCARRRSLTSGGSGRAWLSLLNNDRVRKALKGSINGFLAGMVDDEMLVSYELDVTATRDEEIRGIARVTMTVRPTFSIDFVKVVMFLG